MWKAGGNISWKFYQYLLIGSVQTSEVWIGYGKDWENPFWSFFPLDKDQFYSKVTVAQLKLFAFLWNVFPVAMFWFEKENHYSVYLLLQNELSQT